MLTKVSSRSVKSAGSFAIVGARYNPRYANALVRFAARALRQAGASVRIWRVPGSFEIPVVAAELARWTDPPFDGIICFGVILRGATTHAQHIAEGVTNALSQLQVERGVPVIHGVLLFENEAQARERCLDRTHNRGIEAAHVALEMEKVMKTARRQMEKKTASP